MKFMLPVAAGMFVAAGSCCCCGGDMSELFEEIEAAAKNGGGGSPDVDASAPGDAAEVEALPADAPTVGAASGTTDGLCGRFKSEGMPLPSGFSVIGCTTTAGTESVLAMGATPPKEVCSSLKTWATSGGWNVESEVDMSGTIALSLKNGADRMSLSCTDSTGQTAIAVSISPL